MKIIQNTPPERYVASVVTFDPWPFTEGAVYVANSVLFNGWERLEKDGPYYLCEDDENTLAILSDGTRVVLMEDLVEGLAEAVAKGLS